MTTTPSKEARCTCLEVRGEDPHCVLHGDIAYLVSLAFAVAYEGVSFTHLEDPLDWMVRRWEELGGDPDCEFKTTQLIAAIRQQEHEQ